MLVLRGYEGTRGFSVMNADELFFINGGSGECYGYGNTQPTIPSPITEMPPYTVVKEEIRTKIFNFFDSLFN